MGWPGLLQVGIEIGMDAILVKPKRAIGPFVAQVTIREEHHDAMEITEQPVEQGATITDHAFKRPAELVLDVAWSTTPNSNGAGSSSSVLGSLAGAVTGTIGGVTDILDQATGSFSSLSPSLSQLSDVVTQPLANAGSFVQGAISNTANSVIGGAQSLLPNLPSIPSLPDVNGLASNLVSNVPGGVGDALGSVGNFANSLTGGLDPSALVGDLASGITGGLGDALDFSGGLDGMSSALSGDNVGQPKDVYAKFLALQEKAEPFDVFTGKRVYSNMLIAEMTTVTDKTTENALYLRLRLRQIIIVQSATQSSVDAAQEDQEDPEDTASTEDEGDQQLTDAPNYNEDAGNESIDADPSSEPVGA